MDEERRPRFRASPEYWLQALSGSGEVSYTVSSPGLETATASATLMLAKTAEITHEVAIVD